jgi:hypothetical protein
MEAVWTLCQHLEEKVQFGRSGDFDVIPYPANLHLDLLEEPATRWTMTIDKRKSRKRYTPILGGEGV